MRRARTQQLVADVGLGRVAGPAGVAHVLRGVERSEGQAVQEVARVQQARHGAHLPARLRLQHPGHVLQLRHLFWKYQMIITLGRPFTCYGLRPSSFSTRHPHAWKGKQRLPVERFYFSPQYPDQQAGQKCGSTSCLHAAAQSMLLFVRAKPACSDLHSCAMPDYTWLCRLLLCPAGVL